MLRAEFNDGWLEMNEENGCMTACGKLAHEYMHKLNKAERNGKNIVEAFQGFLNCTVIL